MMRTLKILFLLLAVAALLWRCKQTYTSPYASPATGYLVVEGYITGNGPTKFTLSHTIPLPGDSAIPAENGAQVQVEGNDNSVYPLPAQGNGVYSLDTLSLNTTAQYRLRITTGNGEKYLSDFVPFKPTPVIDSISWVNNSNGVNIYANTHDATNTTRYYQWQYDETWEYHSSEQSDFVYQPNTNPVSVIPRTSADLVWRCWHSRSSTAILLGSSAKLMQDVIYQRPLENIPPASEQLGVLYSIIVRQYALTENGYNFLTLMQKNTESLGSIFDVQPSQVVGNIHCLSNPAEPVIGYISAGTVQQQRIFISSARVPGWGYEFFCPNSKDKLVPNNTDSFQLYFGEAGYIPTEPVYQADTVFGYDAQTGICVDCTLRGGTTQAPSFWPN
jgi:hypothetical protein